LQSTICNKSSSISALSLLIDATSVNLVNYLTEKEYESNRTQSAKPVATVRKAR